MPAILCSRLSRITFAILWCLAFAPGQAQPFLQAHAHNDYEHARPLFDALQNGFGSVEADVYLIKGQLLVSHLRPIFGGSTLEELYLRPLDSLAKLNKGRIYPHYAGTFFLMIDIKADGPGTYRVLKEQLSHYPNLTRLRDSFRPVTIFLSGERPKELVLHDSDSLLSLDGRPEDLGKSYPTAIMPVISDNFHQWSNWNGKGPSDLRKIKDLASRVHAEGKRVRLWAIPDQPAAWKALLEAGVDIINSDHLPELQDFLKNRQK